MKKHTAAVLAILLASFFAGSAMAEELAKEGTGNYRSARSAKLDILKLGKERLQINYDETGVVVEAPANSPFHNASFRTMGTVHVADGMLNYNGSAVWTRPNGDQVYGTFTGEGKRGGATTGFLEIVGGEGECAGIRGTLKLKSGPYLKSSKKGTSQGTTEGTISWRIP